MDGTGTMIWCPKVGPGILYAREDPNIYMAITCDAYKCEVCGPKKVKNIQHTMAWAASQHERSRFVTLTLAPLEWQVRRQRMRDLTRRVLARHSPWNVVWTTEVGSKTGMVHIHALQWGSFIPQADLERLWGARVDIRQVKSTPGDVSAYMTKGASAVTRYMSKGSVSGYSEWRDLNGGRPLHWSSGFLGGLTYRQAAREARAGKREYTWCAVGPYSIRAFLDQEPGTEIAAPYSAITARYRDGD